MSESPPIPDNVFTCTQCGGELHPDEGQVFLTCPYCSSTVYIDKKQVVFHWYLAPTMDEPEARASLARWMAGNETVKDLDKKSRLTGSTFQFFPIWFLKRRQADAEESIVLELAAATSVTEIRNIKLPAGDLRKYDPSVDPQAVAPSVPLDAALAWLEERHIPRDEIVERSLVHIPLWAFKYNYQGKDYLATVEGGTGGVFANIYPAKAETPYRLIGGVAAAVFLCLATWPLIGAMAGPNNLGIGALACVAGGIVAAPILFAFAAWVAAKI